LNQITLYFYFKQIPPPLPLHPPKKVQKTRIT
jgi:hypothetical protein